MNKKAELFDAYLKDKKITAFTVDEIKDDPLHTTVFRSHIEVGGARLHPGQQHLRDDPHPHRAEGAPRGQ